MEIMQVMGENTGEASMSGVGGGLSLNMGESEAITLGDFTTFSVVTLLLTTMFSGFIISTIRKGNIKEGFHMIPIYMIVTLVLYFLARWMLGLLLGGVVNL